MYVPLMKQAEVIRVRINKPDRTANMIDGRECNLLYADASSSKANPGRSLSPSENHNNVPQMARCDLAAIGPAPTQRQATT